MVLFVISCSIEGKSSGEPNRECEGTYSLLQEEDGASTNHNSEKEKKKEKNREQERETDDNKLLSSDRRKQAERLRENVFNTPDEQEGDKDYEDPDDDRNNIYYVLEGPTPVEGEDGEREVKGASAGEYEVPVILDKKRKTKINTN